MWKLPSAPGLLVTNSVLFGVSDFIESDLKCLSLTPRLKSLKVFFLPTNSKTSIPWPARLVKIIVRLRILSCQRCLIVWNSQVKKWTWKEWNRWLDLVGVNSGNGVGFDGGGCNLIQQLSQSIHDNDPVNQEGHVSSGPEVDSVTPLQVWSTQFVNCARTPLNQTWIAFFRVLHGRMP